MTIPLAVFDTETDGVDTENAHIVTAYFAVIEADGSIRPGTEREWLICPSPDFEMPAGAAAVNGLSTEKVHAEGRTDVKTAIFEIASTIHSFCSQQGLPLSGQNLAFDLSLLDAELRRHEWPRLAFAVSQKPIFVLDSIVLDKHYDQFRKGNRKLITLAAHYGVAFTEEDAHDASFDALASGRVVQAIIRKHIPYLAQIAEAGDFDEALRTLHNSQVNWRAEQQVSLEKYLRKQKDPDAVCDPGWPLYTATRPTQQKESA